MWKCIALSMLVMLANACWVGPVGWVAAGFHDGRGDTCYRKGDYDCAIREYSQAIDLMPRFAVAFNNRGLAYEAKGNHDRAIQDFSEAIRLQPAYVLAYHNRARAYLQQGDYDRALQDYDAVIRLRPHSAEAFHYRGIVYAIKGEHERALQDYDRAIRLNPNLWSAYHSRGLARFNLGQFNDARDDFSTAMHNSNFSYTAIWLYLATARAGQRNTAELTKNAAELDPAKWPGPVIQFYLGTISADQLFQAANNADSKKQNEQYCEAYFYLGESALLRGKKADAGRQIEQAAATCPTNFIESAAAKAELARMNVTKATAAKQHSAAVP